MAASLAACGAVPRYHNPHVTQAQAERDQAQCKYEASLATAGYGTSNTRRGVSSAAGQGVAEGIAQSMDKIDLVQQCYEARGYRRVQ